jgi:hypothetical protein
MVAFKRAVYHQAGRRPKVGLPNATAGSANFDRQASEWATNVRSTAQHELFMLFTGEPLTRADLMEVGLT